MGKDFTVTLFGERGEEYEKVIGTRTINVRSPFPEARRLEGKAESELVYMVDLDLLTDEQRKKLIEHVANKFGADVRAVEAAINALGLPIRASETVVTVDHPQKWLLDDAPNAEELEKFDIMSDLDDDPNVDDDGFGDYE